MAFLKQDRLPSPFDRRQGDWVSETTAPNLKQVISVYAFVVALFAPIFLFITFREPLRNLFGNEDIPAGICFLIPLVAMLMPYYLRKKAITRMIKQMDRTKMGLGQRSGHHFDTQEKTRDSID